MMIDYEQWQILTSDHQIIIKNIIGSNEILKNYIVVAITIGAAAIIIGIAILWNQRKIKKQLRQLLEEKKQEE